MEFDPEGRTVGWMVQKVSLARLFTVDFELVYKPVMWTSYTTYTVQRMNKCGGT